jgi:hypothetical protein
VDQKPWTCLGSLAILDPERSTERAMPRRSPARVRASQRRRERAWYRRHAPQVPGASGSLNAALRRLEDRDAGSWPGRFATAFHEWRRIACAPGRALRNGVVGCSLDCCCPRPREALEVALHCLPRRSARELRRLLAPLDARVENRTVPDPTAPAGQEWSRRGLLTASSRMGIDRSVSLCLVPHVRGA